MHVRLSHCLGFPVMEEGGDHILGTISGILIEPDTGKIEGFFVTTEGLLGAQTLYCSALDIVRWGTRVYVNSQYAIAPAEDRIRLQPLLKDPRTVLGQTIRLESGASLGTCKDIQFNTDRMHIEWLFPKKWFWWGVALPVTDILEVTPKAIIIRDPMKKEFVTRQEEDVVLKAPLTETPTVTRST